ncbi:MAG: ECF transporter S component [Bacillota bacterium]|nr:ECF transporter S component [Bacillota bacterium]
MTKPLVKILLLCAAILIFAFSFVNAAYVPAIIIVAACSVALFYYRFEHREHTTALLILITVMTSLSVFGRFIFAFIPGFKPVTALVIITGMYLGKEAGFLTGSLTAMLSNFYFGQGLWTPLQMLVWGFIGFFAGLLWIQLQKSRIILILYGIISGVIFSVILDFLSVLWIDNSFNLKQYLIIASSSIPFIIIYAASNTVFLLLLKDPFARKLTRIKTKLNLQVN